nr:hypothetical protein [Tanacetum cinerariifolium]
MQVSRERSTEGRVKTQALETALSQLASAHIQLNSYKAENKTLSQRYEELAKSNMASHVQLSGIITALTMQNATLKAKVTGKQNSGSKSLAKPKVTTTGMVFDTTKYIPPQRRLNRVAPTPYPTKKQVTFQGNPKQLSRPTRNERLSSGNCDSYVVQNWKPVNRKTTTIKQVFQPVKQVVTPVKKVWKATGKVFARVGFQLQPTGRMFTLDDMCPLNRITSSKESMSPKRQLFLIPDWNDLSLPHNLTGRISIST